MIHTQSITKSYKEPAICKKEILRYAGCKINDATTLALIDACIDEVRDKLTYKVCYQRLPLTIRENVCDFGTFSVESKDLTKNLSGCEEIILFAATIGIEIDRQITKYSHISPTKALLFQAIGAERIESLCDAFCKDIASEYGLHTRPRYSAGYGDVPLDIQTEIFRQLSATKQIGVTLNSSLLMSPSKSVTAFVGLTQEDIQYNESKCMMCNRKDCAYKGDL